MAHAEFVHLHLHTEYSLLDGACRMDKLMEKAHELKFPAVTLTDHGNLYGAIEFYQQAQDKGLKPIIGCEVYVARGSRFEKKSSTGGKDVYHHLALLAKDETGYQNLVKLVTAGFLEGYYYKPRIDKELLEAHSEGLIALSGCLASEVPDLIQCDETEKARDTIDWFKQIFGPENYYLELQNHGIPEQTKVNRHLIPWSQEFGLKLVATNDVHYLERDHSHAHDILICIGTQSLLNDEKRMRYEQEQFYMRSADEMAELFKEVPEAVKNTLEVAEKCNLEIELNQLHYPVFDPPEHFSRDGYLRHVLAEGLHKRYGLHVQCKGKDFVVEHVEDRNRLSTYKPDESVDEGDSDAKGAQEPGGESESRHPHTAPELSEPALYRAVQTILDRLHTELGTIEQMGFVSYFLIVGDFVRYGRSQGISCVARGSAAGSLVTYLLEISNVCPLRYGLIFERFLNPQRLNPPDIDIDFADDRREDVIEYTRQKYGRDSVAQIITFGTMGAKSVVRDVGRVMGLTYGECDRLAKMIPNELKMTLDKALQQSPDLKQAYDTEEVTRELIDSARVLEDLTRNTSVHAAGVVIGDQPLVNLLPLKQDEEGTTVTQYAMGPVGDLGLLKMDFLGLKTLSVMRNACEMAQQTKGVDITIDTIPFDDQKAYELLNRGHTVGVFQLESGGMRDLCRKFQIGAIEHIIALISLYRPGPMDLIPEFLQRRHGEVAIEYPHPLLKPIAEETYGILIYQEQVMQAAQVLAGFSLGGADLLRRAMGKKKVEEMQKQREIFVKGCWEVNEIPAEKANQIFDLLEKFAGYGFNKSHAAAYAVVAYQTAYLKANHPVEFLAAMMTNDMNDTAKLSMLINEARSFGIDVLPPDVNESQVGFAPGKDGTVIRFGLAAIKGVGEVAVENVLEARRRDGRFTSLADLCERVDSRSVGRRVLEYLIKCGACDCFGETRATLYAEIDHALARAATLAQDRMRGQASLFGEMEEEATMAPQSREKLTEWPQHELLAAEKELLGFYVTGHPLTPYAPVIDKYCLATTAQLSSWENRSMTRLGGMITDVQSGVSKRSNKPYALVTLEDLEGVVQVLCLNENYDKYRDLLVTNQAILVVGEVNNNEEKPKLFPQEIFPLDDAPKRYTKQVHFRLNLSNLGDQDLETIRSVAMAHTGNCPLYLCLSRPNGAVVFIEAHERYSVTPSRELQQKIDELFGEHTYYPKVDTSLPEKEKPVWKKEPVAA